MASNVLGYIGIENHEIILYLSQVLKKLGKKVLLVDYSLLSDLAACIPVPQGLSAMEDIIAYNGVDFTQKELNTVDLQSYDDILISFGFQGNSYNSICTRICYVTDQQKVNIEKLVSLPEIESTPKYLLIKEAVDSKITQDYIVDRLKKDIKTEDIYVFNQDAIDTKYKILTQYNTLFEFKKITRGVKAYLKNTVRWMHPNITEKELKRAYKIAERGH